MRWKKVEYGRVHSTLTSKDGSTPGHEETCIVDYGCYPITTASFGATRGNIEMLKNDVISTRCRETMLLLATIVEIQRQVVPNNVCRICLGLILI